MRCGNVSESHKNKCANVHYNLQWEEMHFVVAAVESTTCTSHLRFTSLLVQLLLLVDVVGFSLFYSLVLLLFLSLFIFRFDSNIRTATAYWIMKSHFYEIRMLNAPTTASIVVDLCLWIFFFIFSLGKWARYVRQSENEMAGLKCCHLIRIDFDKSIRTAHRCGL